MELNLQGKTVLVTGSSSGIGKYIAKSFHNEGCNVVLNGRDENKLLKTFSEFSENASYFVGDVTNPQVCKEMIEDVVKKWDKIDVLVCNVGSGRPSKQDLEPIEEWNEMLSENLFSAINVIHAAEDELAKNNGNIVCISSIAGMEFTQAPVTYSVAKSALNMYVKLTSHTLAKKGIRINAIAPGNILFSGSVWEEKLKNEPKKVSEVLDNVSLKRLGKPEEISNFVIYLSSPLSEFTTGTVVVIDGGQLH